MWEDIIKFFIGTIFGSGAITFIIVYLGKRIIDASFSKKITEYEAEFARVTFEHKTKFSKLHEKRALIISELFFKLVKVQKSMTSFVSLLEISGDISKEEKGKIAVRDFNRFIDFFCINEIYFQDEISDLIEKIISEMKNAFYTFTAYPSYKKIDYYLPDPKLEEVEEKKSQNWIKAWEKISKDIPPLKEKLKKELQKIIGVE
jgi:hypothetical protein